MNLKMHYLTALLGLCMAAFPAFGQEGGVGEVELMTKRYTDSYDSLMNSFYMRQYRHSRLLSKRELSLEEFDEEWHAYIAGWEAKGGNFREFLRQRAIPDPAQVLYTTEEGEEEVSLFH